MGKQKQIGLENYLTVLDKFSPPPEFHRTFLDGSPLAAPLPEWVSWTGQIQGEGLNLTATVMPPDFVEDFPHSFLQILYINSNVSSQNTITDFGKKIKKRYG